MKAELTSSKMKTEMDRRPIRRQPLSFSGLRSRTGQTERWRSLRSDSEGKTQRGLLVKQQSAVRLDSPAERGRASCCFNAQCWLQGGTYRRSRRNATHEACSESVIKQPERVRVRAHLLTPAWTKSWRESSRVWKQHTSSASLQHLNPL